VIRDQDTVKLIVTALGKASRCRTTIALDLIPNMSEMTRQWLIESRLDYDAACIGGTIRKKRPDIRKKRPDIRKGVIRIMRSGRGRQEQKELGREVARSTKPKLSVRRNQHLGVGVVNLTMSGRASRKSGDFRAGELEIRRRQDGRVLDQVASGQRGKALDAVKTHRT